MAQLRDIKNRIDSVKKTRKITQAMKMVAAAKFKRATEATIKARPYLSTLEGILADFSKRADLSALPQLMVDNNSDTDVVIVISGDRGLCGGFNANIIKFAEKQIKGHLKNPRLTFLGNKGYQFFKNKNMSIDLHSDISNQIMSVEGIRKILSPLVEKFKKGEIGRVVLLYNEFASAVSTNLIKKQLLPVVLPQSDNTQSEGHSDFFYEPNQDAIIEHSLEEYIYFSVYKALLESKAAEEGARMAAMDAASDNANEMIKSLTLVFNRTRQAKITSEISEIVAGAEALVQ